MPDVRWVARLMVAVVMATLIFATGLEFTLMSAKTFRSAVRADGLPQVELRPLAHRSQVLAADGSLLSALYEEDRVPVALADVPPVLVDAVLAVEDTAFFEHDGVSLRGLLRAARANATEGGVEQGGSTITQQLVKNAVLDADRTYDRKAREAVLALRMEQEMTKEEILQRYLNTVYFGQGAYGVHAAAERFFAKKLADLELPEAALLAGLISSPEGFDPVRRPEAALARRSHALRRMVRAGFVSPAEAAAAEHAPLPSRVLRPAAQPSDHFTEEVRRQLLDDPRLGATPAERSDTVLRRGVTVHTTLDPRLQAVAEQSVREQLPESPFTAALVAIDPNTGEVKALVGGRNFEQAKFNLATQGARQAGSSFKTIALAAWLAAGRSPEDLVEATAPCEFPTPGAPEPTWPVDNYDGGSGEVVVSTLREATVKSANCAYARVALELGPKKLVDMAHRLGVTRRLPSVPSVVLGSGEVSPLEMASIYATLAAEGLRRPPVFIRKVVDAAGRVLVENSAPPERVLEPQVARTTTEVLRAVVDSGTGRRAAIGRPVAGKTGTSQEWRDAWFAGYTPQLAAAVWMGSPTAQESMLDVGGIRVTGGSYPAIIWSQFMGSAMAPLPVMDFTPPDPAAWPLSRWIGIPPATLPPGLVLPAHLLPPPPVPPPPPAPGSKDAAVAPAPGATTTIASGGPPRKGKRR